MQDGTLRIVYRDQQSSFKELLEINSSTKVYVRNHQYLIPEIFKVKKGISPSAMKLLNLERMIPMFFI